MPSVALELDASSVGLLVEMSLLSVVETIVVSSIAI